MGLLGAIAGGGNSSKMKKCKWCGRYFDPSDNYSYNSSFCSLKCEDEYYDDGPEAADEQPKNTVSAQQVKIIHKTKKVLQRK